MRRPVHVDIGSDFPAPRLRLKTSALSRSLLTIRAPIHPVCLRWDDLAPNISKRPIDTRSLNLRALSLSMCPRFGYLFGVLERPFADPSTTLRRAQDNG